MSDNKYLSNARRAKEEGNGEDAKKFYDMARTEDPDNGEAKFFYQYYALYEGKNGEIPTRFKNLVNTLVPAVECVAKSADSDSDKLAIVKSIVDTYVPMTWSLNRYMNNLTVGSGSDRQRVLSTTEISGACVRGVVGLYKLGDTVASLFGDNGMNLAVAAWKEAISLNQKWYAYKYDGYVVEDYAAKIQKVDPTYEIPKKAGCISFADKKN